MIDEQSLTKIITWYNKNQLIILKKEKCHKPKQHYIFLGGGCHTDDGDTN